LKNIPALIHVNHISVRRRCNEVKRIKCSPNSLIDDGSATFM
jgi:hypothetical protein